MLGCMKQRFGDMKTLSTLIQTAESISLQRGEGKSLSVEHFVLAAIEQPDGAAKAVFEQLGLQAEGFEAALREQHKHSLNVLGVDIDTTTQQASDDQVERLEGKGLPEATKSGTQLLRHMSELKRRGNLTGADVLRAVHAVPEGPAHRAFVIMGTSAEKVGIAANRYLGEA